jgi:glycolate oxidase iron-sulfur subunit
MREKFSQDKLDRCISCGYCLPACPTYKLTGNEESSPRGRITLMRAVQNDKLPALDLLKESSFCLGCRACEPVCPAGVEYGVLLEEMREITWQGKNRPLIIRGLFFIVDTKIGMWALGLLSPFAKRREANKDLHLMYGCFERRLFPAVSRAVAKLAPEVSCSSDQGCCGALHAHNGELEKGKEMAKALGEKLPGTILTTAGGCAAHLASVIGNERVQEFSQWWVKREIDLKPIEKSGRKIRVGLQDSCHLRNGMGVFAQPRKILAQLGDYVEIPGAADCCGAAGSYALLQKQNSRKVVSQKVADIKALNLDYIATVNPGCTRQLVTELRRARVKTKVIHLAQLVALSQNK